jgi:hypothetical protein
LDFGQVADAHGVKRQILTDQNYENY